MTLVKVNPHALGRPTFFRDFDRVFDDMFGGTTAPARPQFKPGVNVVETPGAYRLEVAAPGLQKEDFSVEIEQKTLTISVEKEFPQLDGETIKRREFGNYSFKRSFRLSDQIDTEGIDATYENGVLKVTLPKVEAAKEKPARKIEIS